eukprot:TRINITY_DN9429_c0_g1_i2.p1 TRINITY_DN9429_c0_g1~~TRINITY_DN9429_c0_g1_i2.p1  ORF type:complete len:143 (+),score=26.87 TRINITY_DN9429_c0_g1_i2:11-439(+)
MDEGQIFYAITTGDYPLLANLLRQNPNLAECEDADDDTPMHAAAAINGYPCIDLLLAYGANINARGCSARTPLNVAACENHIATFKYLLEKGAELDIDDSLDETVLHKIANSGSLEAMQLLLQSRRFELGLIIDEVSELWTI